MVLQYLCDSPVQNSEATDPLCCTSNCWEASGVDTRCGLDRGTTFKRFMMCLVLYQVLPCNAMLSYLQKKLPLDRPLIRDLTCLDPANKDKSWSVNAIKGLYCSSTYGVFITGVLGKRSMKNVSGLKTSFIV